MNDIDNLVSLFMSGYKENLILCGYFFQNMEQSEINEVFKEIFHKIDEFFLLSDSIDDFYNKVDVGYLKIHWSEQYLVVRGYQNNGFLNVPNYDRLRIFFYTNPNKETIVEFLTNL